MKCYNGEQTRLLLAIRDCDVREFFDSSLAKELSIGSLRSIVNRAMLAVGAEHLLGRAPQGALEHLLQGALEDGA